MFSFISCGPQEQESTSIIIAACKALKLYVDIKTYYTIDFRKDSLSFESKQRIKRMNFAKTAILLKN